VASAQPHIADRTSRIPLFLLLAGYAVLAAIIQGHCVDLLTSDGECFLRMARYYAQGDFAHAVFGHWSPLAAWMAAPLVVAGVPARVAFRVLIGLWGAGAVFGVWRLAGRLGERSWLRTGAVGGAALMAVEFGMDHRVDLLVTALLLLVVDASLDERLLGSARRAAALGALGGVAYLAKLYALPYFVAYSFAALAVRAWAERRLRAAACTWGIAMGVFLLIAAPWVGVLSAKFGRLTFGTAASTSYALVGAGSGSARADAIAGLRRPPEGAYNVWQDATLDAAKPKETKPVASLAEHAAAARRNAEHVVRHLWALDEFRFGFLAAVLLPVAAVATRRRREVLARYAQLSLAVAIYCGGYVLIQAENRRYFWFVFFVLVAVAFHLGGVVIGALARRVAEKPRRLALAAVGVAMVVSFAYHPVRAVAAALRAAPLGRQHRLLAERLRSWGQTGVLASVGERAWWQGLHVAYYLDAQYAGTPEAETARGIVAEMRGVGATTLLVWDEPKLLGTLSTAPDVRLVGIVSAGSVPGLGADVAVFGVRPRTEDAR